MSKLEKVKDGKNYTLFVDGKGEKYIAIRGVRASYPFIGSPSEGEDDDGNSRKNFRVVGMLPKNTHREAKDAVKALIQELIEKNKSKVPADKWFLADGNEKEDEVMHEHFLVTAANTKRPVARDNRAEVMDDIAKIDDMFYGGCWINMLIRPWFFNGKAKGSSKTFPKRISANLVSVQFVKNDDPFGNGRVDESDVWDTEVDGVGDDGDDDGL